MKCVNKVSKEFKYLAKHNNLDIDTLARITHKYWIETGNEDSFPSNVYIQAQLGKIPYQEAVKEVREVWETLYKEPREFSTIDEILEEKNNLIKLFPEKAIQYHKNANNTYTLVVRQPVESINLNIEDYIGTGTPTEQELKDFDIIKNSIAEHKETQKTPLDVSSVDNAIKTGNWTDEALEQLDNIIDIYNNGRNEITQVLGRRLSEKNRSSEAYAAASSILRRVQGSMRQGDGTLSAIEEFTARNKERRLAENAIQQWAQENGWWWNDYAGDKFLDDYLISEYGKERAEGSESIVHLSKNGKYVIKAISAIASDGELLPLLQKIELHNQVFPDTALEILGFGRTKDGNFRVILQQPFIKGEHISAEEAEKFLEERLLTKNDKDSHSQTIFDEKVILKDITNPQNRGNILKDADGNYFVIDADIAFSEEAKKEILSDSQRVTTNNELSGVLNTIDEAIRTSNWTADASDRLNTLITDIENERKEYNRFVLREQQDAFKRGGRIYEAASIILGRNEERSRNESSNKGREREETFAEKAERREAEGKEQERIIESWAKSQDLWLNDYKDPDGSTANSLEDLMSSQWDYLDGGSEATVYVYDESTVIKAINLSHYDNNLLRAMDKIALHNTLSPNTALEVVGFGRDGLGHFRIIAVQPYIQGKELTEDEFEKFKKRLDLKEKDGWHYVDNYKITDLAPYNIKKYHDPLTEKDEYGIIDADFWIDAEDAEIDNSISTTTNTANQNNDKEESENKETIPTNAAPEKTTKLDSKLSKFDSITQQIKNLQESNLIPASEITHVAELIMNDVSDSITKLQTTEGLAAKWFPSLKTTLDFQKATRREIVNAVGINRLLDRAKKLFDSENVDYADMETELQADLVVENWDGILSFGMGVFSMNEGFGIKMNYENGTYDFAEGKGLGLDDTETSHDPDAVAENEKDEQEHWQIEQRTLDVLKTAPEIVRMAIHNCYKTDSTGAPVVSKWGIKERMNPRTAITNILNWTQGALTLSEMRNRLTEKEPRNKWLSSLLIRLSDTSGKESDFQSQFFTTMCKTSQRFSYGIKEDGKYHINPLNEDTALSDMTKSIAAQFALGEHPLFKNGVNTELLGSEDTIASDDFNLFKARHELQQIVKDAKKADSLTEQQTEDAKKLIEAVAKVIGYTPSEETLDVVVTKDNVDKMTTALNFMVNTLKEAVGQADYDPFKYRGKNNIRTSVRDFLKPIADVMNEGIANVVYNDGKLYQQFVTPSYLSLLIKKFKWEGKQFDAFMQNEYGYSEWFKQGKRWRNEWLRLLSRLPEARELLSHDVELNFNKKMYMKNMTDAEYTISVLSHYWAEASDEKQSMVPAWFRIPIQSNKPSSEFIRFYSFRGPTYKTHIIDGLYDMFLQEISRIQTVNARNLEEGDPRFITNWDKNGRKFNFLPFLNDYLSNGDIKKQTLLRNADNTVSADNKKLADMLQKLEKSQKIEDEALLSTLVKKAIKAFNEARVEAIIQNWQQNGIFKASEQIEGIGKSEIEIYRNLENFLWNDHYAALNILQLTIGDIAAYANAEDLQKRLAQLHAPGLRPNTEVRDYYGQEVTDGTYRTILLDDFDNFVSNIIDNLSEVFDKLVERAPADEKEAVKALKEDLVGENGRFRNINVADAQGYCSPTSYRKKAFMFGKWSQEAETTYQKILNGTAGLSDIKTAFQPLKPFVYSQMKKSVGTEDSPISKMPIPFQAKNSEYLLIMADALLQNESLSRPNLLRAIYRVMEDSAFDGRKYDDKGNIADEGTYNGKGIDTIQFKSAIKSGLQAPINIHQFLNAPNGEEAAYSYITSLIYKTDEKGSLTTEYNTDTYVHESDFSAYCLQQEIPAHFQNHSQIQGSQERMIIPSDLFYYKNPNGDLNSPDNIVTYPVPNADGTVTHMKADEIKREYETVIANKVIAAANNLAEELGLPTYDINGNLVSPGKSMKERNLALSEILQKEILDSAGRYGVDMFLACSINKDTGEFVIPKGDPIQAKRIEQLINAIIKDRINKQEMPGGPIVQVTNFGTSKQLHIRFKDRNGNLLPTKEDYEKNNPGKSYKEFIKNNQGGVAHFEVFAPIWMKDLYYKFADEDGVIDIGSIELLSPEMLKMISYRIPTEDKYSIAPMKVVGFMPREAGDAIMLPYELTEIDDSDFDIDKRYVIRKEIKLASRVEQKENESMSDAEKEYIKNNSKDIIDHLAKSVNLQATANQAEIAEIEKRAEDIASIKRKNAEKKHLEILDTIERRDEQISDAEAAAAKDAESFAKRADKQEKAYDRAVEKENRRYQTELEKIEDGKQSTIQSSIKKFEDRKIRNRVQKFLNEDRFKNSSKDNALTRELRKAYLDYMFRAIEPAIGDDGANNRIFDLTWSILTHEMTASQLLNPGGFDPIKKQAYVIAAFKSGNHPELSWEDLQGMSIKELKKLYYTDKDLSWVDTQIQFYKQNAAAASLIGVFAVHKVAHAVLENNGYLISVDDLLDGIQFTIGDKTFGGQMLIDPTFDKTGAFIGKVLGSFVSSAADAVKDPILNLMNINMTTVNMLTSLIRLGMPFEEAVLFMSQDVISKALEVFNRENLSKKASLNSIVDSMLEEIKKEHSITNDSSLNTESLSHDELIGGLLSKEHPEIDYKVLTAFKRVKTLADAMRKPTFATRLNSISSAVGPRIIDNLVLEHKVDQFNTSSGFYHKDDPTLPIDIFDVFDRHPILKAFYRGLTTANTMFLDMPAGSTGFRNLLAALPSGISDVVYGDTKILSALSDFYQSYLLIKSGLIDETKLSYYINEFPKKFMQEKKKEKYANNVLIQNLQPVSSNKTGRTFLQIKLLGLSDPEKDMYRSAWIELHKENPELSNDLLNYFFFRAGIGFSPKTGMGLVSTYIKENWKNNNVSYIDVYRSLPVVYPELVIDQFISNNWNNNSLVPKKEMKPQYILSKDRTLLEIPQRDINEFKDTPYMKTTIGDKTYLWKLIGDENDASNQQRRVYRQMVPLGDNNEYIEMSTKPIVKPLSETTFDVEDYEASAAITQNIQDAEIIEDPVEVPVANETEKTDADNKIVDMIMLQWKLANYQGTIQDATQLADKIKNSPERYIKFIQNMLKTQGIECDAEEAMKKFKELC